MKTKTILFVNDPKSDYLESLKYSFPDCDLSFLNNYLAPPEIEKLASDVNKKYDQVIFFDYCYNYYLMLPIISKKIKVKWILTTSIASLFNADIYSSFFQVIEYKERKLVDVIAALDYSTYLVFKNKYDFKYLTLDINKRLKVENNNSIGIIGYDYIEGCSFFNELSAVTMSDIKKVSVQNAMNVTKKFGTDFNLNLEVVEDIYQLISKGKINLYINFYDTKVCNFLCSMDNGVPCLLGNTNLLDDNQKLKNLLVVKSDDNIDEMAEKIKNLESSNKDLFKEYKKWRKSYSERSKKLITEFAKI